MRKTYLLALVALSFCSVAPPAQSFDFPICGKAKRINCIVDGDTAWINRVKYRLKGVDTPEMCKEDTCECNAAKEAQIALRDFLSSGEVRITTFGKGSYRRTLAKFEVGGVDAGEYLLSKDLARVWPDGVGRWCK